VDINGFVAILALPLLFPMGLLFLLKGLLALRSRKFELYWADYEGMPALFVGGLAVVLSLLLLGFCTLLLMRALHWKP
jgi:hypothetical protein